MPGWIDRIVDAVKDAISPPEVPTPPTEDQYGAPTVSTDPDPEYTRPIKPPEPEQAPYRQPGDRPNYDDPPPQDGDAGAPEASLPGGTGQQEITGSGMTDEVLPAVEIVGGAVAGVAIVGGLAAAGAAVAGEAALATGEVAVEAGEAAEAAGAFGAGAAATGEAGGFTERDINRDPPRLEEAFPEDNSDPDT